MRIYKVSRFVKNNTTNGEWESDGVNYYSTNRKAHNKINNEIAFEGDNAHSIKTVTMSAEYRDEILYCNKDTQIRFTMSPIDVE